jgi:hypothetical protein
LYLYFLGCDYMSQGLSGLLTNKKTFIDVLR